jgi:hypothetical protein
LVWDVTNTVASWMQTGQYTGMVTIATVYPGKGAFTNLNILGNCTLNGGGWTHIANSSTESNRLRVSVGGDLFISNATITADALGYAAGIGTGNPGAGSTMGGAYGGATGAGTTANVRTYGSIIAPANLGSGGGYGNGGGAIILTVGGTTTVAGAGIITANGGGGFISSGSGGSVYLTTGWLAGNGAFRANGGPVSGYGSGGRVAIVLTGSGANFSLWNGTNTAYAGGNGAAAGTVYRKTAAGVDTLIIDNNNAGNYGQVSTLISNAVNLNSFSNVVIHHKGILGIKGDAVIDFNTFNPATYGSANSALALESDTNVTYPASWTIDGYTLYLQGIPNIPGNVTIGTNGVLSSYQNSGSEAFKLNFAISGNLTVLANGMITVDGLGYAAATGPGGGSSGGPYGGAYGGVAVGSSNTYGSIFAPTNFGSGGGYGNGGGAIQLTVAGTTTVASAGLITANGVVGLLSAGSGGSVYLTTGWLTGSGTLRANGGGGVSASGGRVAIILTGPSADFGSWDGTNSAYGGTAAAAGTVYRLTGGAPAGTGTIMVDNRNTTANQTFTCLPAFRDSAENLTKSTWLAQNKGRIGIITNASIWSLTLNTNSYLELVGRTLTTKLLTITNNLYKAGIYSAAQLGTLVSDSFGGGSVRVTGLNLGTVVVVK